MDSCRPWLWPWQWHWQAHLPSLPSVAELLLEILITIKLCGSPVHPFPCTLNLTLPWSLSTVLQQLETTTITRDELLHLLLLTSTQIVKLYNTQPKHARAPTSVCFLFLSTTTILSSLSLSLAPSCPWAKFETRHRPSSAHRRGPFSSSEQPSNDPWPGFILC